MKARALAGAARARSEDLRATIYSAGTHGQAEISNEIDANSLKPKLVHQIVLRHEALDFPLRAPMR